jgi:polyhydroxybutyrate depolymerase
MNINQSCRFLSKILVSILTAAFIINIRSIQAEENIIVPESMTIGDSYGKLYDQGKWRTYYLYIPKSYNTDRPMPLVLVFHGDEGSGKSISKVTKFNQLAEKNGFILVYPDGINQRWSLKGRTKGSANDVLFVSALIEYLQQKLNIDSHKIYAAGFSRGAILTQALACELPDKIAGFASVAGSLPVRLIHKCQLPNPVSILAINGTNDQEVLYEGDDYTQHGALVSISDMVHFWRSHDHCTSRGKSPFFSRKTRTSLYTSCNGDKEVLRITVINGGHFWPGGMTTDKNLNKFNSELGLNASEVIWDFFQKQS